MSFHARPISFKPPRLKGLSARLIASHYENNYGGAVRRLNAIRGELANLDPASAPGFRLNGLKREELIATNSMLLHEAYFEALGEGGGGDPSGPLAEAIARDFGSLAKWRAEFVAMGKALGGGSGWVVLSRSPRDGTPGQRLVGRPHPQPGRRHAAAGARHVRARLSHRLRRQRRRPMSMPSWPTSPGSGSPRALPAWRLRAQAAHRRHAGRARRCSTPIPTWW